MISESHLKQSLIFQDLNSQFNSAENKMPNTIEPVSISSYKKYGITRQNLNYLMTHFHTFPHEFKDCLSKYYLLYWSGSHFQSQLHEGKLTHDNITYDVIYLGCTPENIKFALQIKVSFRMAQPEFNLRPVAIISARKE